jgi:hypothetical protein
MLGRAMETRHAVLRADPQNFRVRVLLLGDHARLATILRDQKRLPESRATLQAAFALAAAVTGPAANNPELQQALADLRAQAALTR